MATSATSPKHFENLHEIFSGLLEDLRGVPERLLGTTGTEEKKKLVRDFDEKQQEANKKLAEMEEELQYAPLTLHNPMMSKLQNYRKDLAKLHCKATSDPLPQQLATHQPVVAGQGLTNSIFSQSVVGRECKRRYNFLFLNNSGKCWLLQWGNMETILSSQCLDNGSARQVAVGPLSAQWLERCSSEPGSPAPQRRLRPPAVQQRPRRPVYQSRMPSVTFTARSSSSSSCRSYALGRTQRDWIPTVQRERAAGKWSQARRLDIPKGRLLLGTASQRPESFEENVCLLSMEDLYFTVTLSLATICPCWSGAVLFCGERHRSGESLIAGGGGACDSLPPSEWDCRPKGKRIQFFAEEAAERAGLRDADTVLFGCERLDSSPKLRPHSPGQGRGNLRSPPLRCSRAALRTRVADPAPPPRVGTYSGRGGGGGGGLRAVAGGVDSCPSAGIWDRAVPRRPGEWRCGTWAGAVGCGSTVPRARLRPETPLVRLGGSGRRPTAHPAAFVQHRLSSATLRAGWLSRLFK
ncbi:Vesicle transport through interaction with t-SNAREs homolog 1B [Lemmus lemmus]